MYPWKCWRDTRFHFVVALLLAGGALALMLVACLQYSNETGYSLLPRDTPEEIARIWVQAMFMLGAVGMVLAPVAGLLLGAFGVGEEFATHSLEFLLTRPRRQRYFVWAAWATGAAELLLISLIATGAAFAFLLAVTRTVYTWSIFALAPLYFTTTAVFFGLTYLGTTVARSARNAQAFSFLVLIGYAALTLTFYRWQHVRLPGWWDMFVWLGKDRVAFSYSSYLGWTALALGFPLLAQWIFERAEL